MKKKILTGILLTLVVICNAQNYNVIWQQCYGDSYDNSYSTVVEKIADGFLIGIEVHSDEIGINYHGGYDICIIKTDSSKNPIWKRCYGGSDSEGITKILTIDSSNYYLFGYASSTDGDVQSGNHGYSDVWVVKINSSGEILWERTYGCSGIDDMRDIILTPDGGFVFIDRIGTDGGDVTHFYGFGDAWICKCDSQGNIEWEKSLGNEGLENCISLLINKSNNIVMIGAAQQHGGLVTCYPMGEFGNAWLVELDLQGNIVRQNCYGGSVYETGGHILETDNGYIFAGVSFSNDGDVSGHHGQSGENGCDDIWVVKIDTLGIIVWQKSLGGSSYDSPTEIFLNDTGEIMIFGTTNSIDGDVSGNHSYPGNKDLWMAKLSSEGTLMEQQCFGGTWDEHFNNHAVAKINDYRYIIAAGAAKNDGDIDCNLHGNGDWDAWYFEIKDCDHYAPAIPALPEGPTDVCTSTTAQSLYTIPQAANSHGYVWELLPATSGTLNQSDNQATISWDTSFKGSAGLRVFNYNDCGSSAWSDTLNVFVDSCLSINELSETTLRVYPNPASNYMVFELQKAAQNGIITITDITGRPVASFSLTGEKTVWETVGLKPGVYLFRAETGQVVTSGKIVVMK
jgi:hypothetical protein